MIRLNIDDADRELRLQNRALSLDEHGYEILIGLTRQESEWMVWYGKQYGISRKYGPSTEEKRRHIELNERHNTARLLALGLHFAQPAGLA